ncbi:MAG: L-threonylcarbamoyladenylate synthase, partial [Pseudomonadota bacterium]
MLTDALPPNSRPAELARARGILAQGGIVAVPTETVYGLAADATQDRAVAAIFTAKGRPSFNPLIIHVDGVAMADTYGVLSPLAFALAEAFWPGPLSLVVPVRKGSGLAAAVTAGLPTVAVRHPKGLMADLVAMLNRPLAAPSANRSGRISPTTAAHVARDLGDAVDLILDDGPASVGLESTIVAPQDDGRIQIL